MNNFAQKFMLISLIGIMLSACNSIKDQVNDKFIPINAEEHRSTAINAAYLTLQHLKYPDVAAEIDVNILQNALNANQKLADYNVKKIEMSADKQLLFIKVEIDGKFTSSMFDGLSTDQTKLLDQLSPEVAGTINFGGSITSDTVTDINSKLQINLRILPFLKEVKIEKLVVAEHVDLNKPADFMFDIIKMFADNITGEISRQEFTKISFPAFPVETFETSFRESLQGEDGTLIDINIDGKPITPPNHLKAIAFKIHDQKVSMIAQLASASSQPPTLNSDGNAIAFSEFSSLYDNSISQLVSIEERPKGIWAALSKSRLSELLNSGFEQVKLCVGAKATLPKQEFSEQVKIPDETGIDCTPSRDCTLTRKCDFSQINCQQNKDCRQTKECSMSHINCQQNKDCRTCAYVPCPILRNPGRQCRRCINNPICEADKVKSKTACELDKSKKRAGCEFEKKAQHDFCEAKKVADKQVCEADKSLKITDCVRLNSQEKFQCEAKKTTEKALCETGKETLKRLSRTGKIANVNGFAQASGQMRLCIGKMQFNSEMTSLDLGINIRGRANAKIGIEWMPLDILGHALCVTQWSEHKDIAATIPRQDVDIKTELEFNHKDGSLQITGNIETSELKAELKPSPRDLLLKNYNMQLSCPLIGALSISSAPLVISVSEAIPEMKGDFVFPSNKQDLSFTVEPLEIEIPGSVKKAEANILSTKKAFIAVVGMKK